MVRVQVRVGSGWVELTCKNTGWVMGQPVFASSQKNLIQVRYFSGQVGLENFDTFCHV